MEIFLIIMVLFLLFAMLRPVTMILHELGHAVPAIIFTRGPVSVVIGIPRNLPKDPIFRISRLSVWIARNPLRWFGGYCSHEQAGARWQQAIILFNGVAFSTAIAFLLVYISFLYDLHGFVRTLLLLLATSTVLDIFLNLVPNNKPVRLPDGASTFNDGELLRRLFSAKTSYRSLLGAYQLSQAGKHDEAWVIYEKALSDGPLSFSLFRNSLLTLIQLERYAQALEVYRAMSGRFELSSHDHNLGGYLLSLDGHLDEALAEYDKALAMDPLNPWALNNAGYTYNLLGRYKEAIPLFERALVLEPDAAYPMNNRGLARWKLGDREGGLADIVQGLEKDPNNSYGHRNLGIHHLDEGRTEKALELFLKARSLDPRTHMIDELIAQVGSERS